MPSVAPDFQTGTILKERYKIEAFIGNITPHSFYRAAQLDLPRTVLIKSLQQKYINYPGAAEAFQASIDWSVQLEHQHIGAIYDAGNDDGCPFQVRRFSGFGSLQRLLNLKHPISVSEQIRVLAEVADALDFVHEHGKTHGDIRPTNIILDERGRVLTLDFNPLIGELNKKERKRGYAFASLEQLRNAQLASSSDIFNLAATAFYLISGQLPFLATTLEAHVALRKENLLNPLGIQVLSQPILQVLQSALESKARYQSASELVSAVENALQTHELAQRTSVFISYSRQNPELAEQLVNDLHRNGIVVWFDRNSIETGKPWEAQIRAGILASDKFVVILSPEAVLSDWVQAEIDFATEKQKPIIPVMYKPCDVPLHVRLLQRINFNEVGYQRGLELLLRAILTPTNSNTDHN